MSSVAPATNESDVLNQVNNPGPESTESVPVTAEKVSGRSVAHSFADYEEEQDSSAFECNICLDLAKEPVVTLCGHLFCWPCLYRWIQVQHLHKACPVCKAGVVIDKVIPIYCRSNEDPAPEEVVKQEPLPPRPVGQRLGPVIQAPQPIPMFPQQAQLVANAANTQQQGFFPAMFGFQNGTPGYPEALSAEQQHQAFLSRLLLMLGSFVIMCLLLF